MADLRCVLTCGCSDSEDPAGEMRSNELYDNGEH